MACQPVAHALLHDGGNFAGALGLHTMPSVPLQTVIDYCSGASLAQASSNILDRIGVASRRTVPDLPPKVLM